MNPEIDNFLELFSNESAVPAKGFRESLEKRVVRKYNNKGLWSDLFSTALWRFSATTGVLFVALIVLTVVIVPSVNKPSIYVSNLAATEKEEILEKYAALAPLELNVLKPVETEPQTIAPSEVKEKIEQIVLSDEESKDNNLYTIKESLAYSGGLKQCGAVKDEASLSEYNYYQNKNNGDFLYKTNETTLDKKEVLYVWIGTTNKTADYSIHYKGGEYAVKINYSETPPASYPEPISYPEPVSYTQTTSSNYYNNLFEGENIDFSLEATERGEEYYIFDYWYYINCENGDTASEKKPGNQKIIVESWVKKSDYKTAKTNVYINDKTDSSLLYVKEYSYFYSFIEEDEAGEIFSLKNVNLKEINIKTDYKEEAALTEKLGLLSSLRVTVLVPDRPTYSINNIYTKLYLGDLEYYLDRAFYSLSTYGEKAYEKITRRIIGKSIADMSITSESDNTYLHYQVFDSNQQMNEILKENYFPEGAEFMEEMEITINSNVEKVKVYSAKIEPLSYPDSYPVSYPYLANSNSFRIGILQYRGNQYLFFWDNYITRNLKTL